MRKMFPFDDIIMTLVTGRFSTQQAKDTERDPRGFYPNVLSEYHVYNVGSVGVNFPHTTN